MWKNSNVGPIFLTAGVLSTQKPWFPVGGWRVLTACHPFHVPLKRLEDWGQGAANPVGVQSKEALITCAAVNGQALTNCSGHGGILAVRLASRLPGTWPPTQALRSNWSGRGFVTSEGWISVQYVHKAVYSSFACVGHRVRSEVAR